MGRDHSVQPLTKVLSELERSAVQSAGFVDDACIEIQTDQRLHLVIADVFSLLKTFSKFESHVENVLF